MNDHSTDEIIEQVFQVPHPARLAVSNIRGSVQVRPGKPGAIHLRAVKDSNNGEAQRTQVILSQDEDGSVRVETRIDESGWLGASFRRPCRVDYTVEVPPACSVTLSGVSNTASLEGVQGDVRISTISGEVQLGRLSGALKISSVSADVLGSGLSGPLELDTVSGDVSCRDCQFNSLKASTVSGDLEFHTPLGDGPYTYKSVSGDVVLKVPAETACSVESDSLSGKVHSDLPITRQHRSARHKTLEVQGGGVVLSHNSVSGSLYVSTPNPAVHHESAGDTTTPDHLPMLERIERGEMSVQEALELLNQ